MSPRNPRDDDDSDWKTPIPQAVENEKSVANARERLAGVEAYIKTLPTREQVRAEVTGARRSLEADVVKKADLPVVIQQAIVTEIDGYATGEHVDNIEKTLTERVDNLKKEYDANKPPGFWTVIGSVGAGAITVITTVAFIVNSANSRIHDLDTRIVKLEDKIEMLVDKIDDLKQRADHIDGAQLALTNLITTVAAKIK